MKVLASDFDGTLFFMHEDKQFKAADLKAIKEFQKEGNLFGICSGRPLIGITKEVNDLIDLDFYIVSSGAVILNKQLEIVSENKISRSLTETLCQQYKDEVDVFVQANNLVYSFKEEDVLGRTRISSVDEIEGDAFYGVSFTAKSEAIAKRIKDEINESYSSEVIAFQNIDCVDVVQKECSKGNAIKILKDLLDLDFVAGIGDSYNDLPMLQCVEQPFTFHNAPVEVKENAQDIVGSVSEAIKILMEE